MSDKYYLKNETDIAAHQSFMNFKGALVQAHLSAFTKYACLALQGAFLLNATVGIAAFSDLENGKPSVVACAVGAILAIASAFFAYISQRLFLTCDLVCLDEQIRRYFHILHNESEKENGGILLKTNLSSGITVLTCIASLGCFVYGLCNII